VRALTTTLAVACAGVHVDVLDAGQEADARLGAGGAHLDHAGVQRLAVPGPNCG
jgi:hypothetical protein